MKKLPNILIFNPDSWRGDVMGHLGNPAAVTPNLDEMVSADAVSFRYAFCQNPVCTPSRCSFMSGWYPHVRGHRTMHHMMREDEPVLLRTLKDNGYHVWWGGKNDLVPGQKPQDAYFSERFRPQVPIQPESKHYQAMSRRGEPGNDNYYSFFIGEYDAGEEGLTHRDWANTRGAVDFINNWQGGRPFCLYLPLTYPHPPYAVEEPWFSAIDRSKLPPRIPTPEGWAGKPSMLKGIWERQNLGGWTEERWNELRAVYYGMCARVDHQLGLLLKALKDRGFYDDTAVFFFSDHGDYTGDYGLVEKNQNTFEDCLTRVPFVIKPPKRVKVQPGVRDALVELVDFPATVEDLTGITPKHTHFGRSLLPVLTGETSEHRDAVFCEGGRLHGETHCMERESKGSLDPESYYWPRVGLQSSEGPEHTKAIMCRTRDFKYVRRLYEDDELYDLRSDPGELNNRVNDSALADVLTAMKDRLLTHYLETCDVVPHETDRR